MPAERTKRRTVAILSSDDDAPSRKPKRNKSRPLGQLQIDRKPLTTRADASNGNHVTNSPSKTRATKSSASSQKSRTSQPSLQRDAAGRQPPKEKPIFSFFNAATQRQRSRPSTSPEKTKVKRDHVEEEDLIQDNDSFDEELLSLSQTTNFGSSYPLPQRKKRKSDERDGYESIEAKVLRGSQLFRAQSEGARSTSSRQSTAVPSEDRRPWTDRFAPLTLQELAVHKKKVQDVRNWLEGAFEGRFSKSLLILRGPAGCGKSQTLGLVAKDLGVGIQEWRNPTQTGSSEQGYLSMSAQFDDFVARAGTFGSLSLSTPHGELPPAEQRESQGNSIIALEEFPNTFARSSSALQSFRSSVMQYLIVNTASLSGFQQAQLIIRRGSPIVMIISETLLSTSTASADSFTAHRLLGADILAHPGVSIIDFNPIAPTFMAKALDLILVKEARISGRRKAPGSAVLDRLASLGDIRNAISSLEFLCLQGDDYSGWSGKITFGKGKKMAQQLSKQEAESLETITQRESALGIFHAIGKVVYNKRDSEQTAIAQPPSHLPQHARPKRSEVDTDALLNELGADIQTFIAGLHENYILSCGGIDGEETLDTINGCIDVLSEADILSPDRFGSGIHRTSQGVPGDRLRQDDLSFYTGVQGLLFTLPHPVKRIAPPQGLYSDRSKSTQAGSGGHQMYFPKSVQLWRHVEENDQLLEVIVAKLQGDGSNYDTNHRNLDSASNRVANVESWRRIPAFSAASAAAATDDSTEDSNPVAPLQVHMSRDDLLLERLPYMAVIGQQGKSRVPRSVLPDVERLTKMNFHGRTRDEEAEGSDDDHGKDDWSTDRAANFMQRNKVGIASRKGGPADSMTAVQEKAGNMVLSDDDIEDD